MKVERWDTCEVALTAARSYPHPFRDVDLTATWTHADTGRSVTVQGFYDGGATWRLRFMPSELGTWRYLTRSADRSRVDRSTPGTDPGLDGNEGEVTCVRPTQPYLHGPLAARGFHFFHADGTPRFLVSTRLSCHFASPDVWQASVRALAAHRINRVLFMIGGVHGTFRGLYGPGPDFWSYDLERFQAIDVFIDALRRADILASPYFYYFNDGVQREMTPEQDRAFLRYGMARFGAYANVMPVLSNEVEQKYTGRRDPYDLRSHAWANTMGPYLAEQAVFGLPVTIHNPMETEYAVHPSFYTLLQDWPFPWAACMLRQAQVGALGAAPEIRDDLPEQKVPVYDARAYARHNQLLLDLRRFGVPVINEEPGYEMEGVSWDSTTVNPRPWNTQTADTIIPTFWTAVTAGTYTMWGHAATYELGDPLEGIRKSSTPQRLRILHDFVAALPYWEMEPANDAVSPGEVVVDGVGYRTNFCLAREGEIYLVFSLNGGAIMVELAPGSAYRVTQLDPRTGAQADLGTVELGAGARAALAARPIDPTAGGAQTAVGAPTLQVAGREQVLLFRRHAGGT